MKIEYREAFDLYVMEGERGFSRWEERTGWRYADGFGGVKWDRHQDEVLNTLAARHWLSGYFSFAVPTPAAIELLVGFTPVVEIGAGTGYWAYLVEQAGGRVAAFDKSPGKGNSWTEDGCLWTDVRPGGPRALSAYADHTLFLCWPPYDDGMAIRCLRRYRGRRVVYVGEHEGGCCASDSFFHRLERSWTRVAELDLPQWPGMRDYLTVWERQR